MSKVSHINSADLKKLNKKKMNKKYTNYLVS